MDGNIFNHVGNRVSISNLIASQIEEAILNKTFQPGSKLPSELELCRQFGVSRTSVREALQILSAYRLINVEKGKGIFVNSFTSESVSNPMQKYLKLNLDRNYILDLIHARRILEPAIAREASLNHTEEDINQLEEDINALVECKSGYDELAEWDMAFHLDLARATRNVVIPLLLAPIHNLMPKLKSTVYATISEAKESAVLWHTKIFEAVKERNSNKAYKAMVEHLKIAEQHAEKVFKSKSN
ncbi:MAG: FadR family transcriptional regulator [Bacteroidetes bacterium]|nr:FadR family transcriptional regulator [Bacteroidota bacterium]MBU1680107.1 FadR family transcriptional regulator [Bacteroidota bacterium]MBU2506783.1 FadR family transcriptional regulator [Bacteroidota bacterium]